MMRSVVARTLWCTTAACVVAAAGCHKHHKTPPTDAATAAGPNAAPSSAPHGATGVASMIVGDSSGIRSYLETVDTVSGATFKVEWNPRTVRMDRQETLRTLRHVSPDGATFVFADASPDIRALTRGRVLLVWGIALRKVDSVATVGARTTVYTEPATLPEAIDNGTIRWNEDAHYTHAMVSPHLEPAFVSDSAAKRTSSITPPRASLFHVAAFTPDLVLPAQDSAPSDASANGTNEASGADSELVLPTHAAGAAAGYEYEIGYGYNGNDLAFEADVAKGPEDPSHAFDKVTPRWMAIRNKEARSDFNKRVLGAKGEHGGTEHEFNQGSQIGEEWHAHLTWYGLYEAAQELLDLRLRARGHLSGLHIVGDVNIQNAGLAAWHSGISGIKGEVTIDCIARLGERGEWGEYTKLQVPWSLVIPVIIGGVPFMAEVGMNFILAPALTSHHAAIYWEHKLTFDGSANVQVSSKSGSGEGSLSGEDHREQNTTSSIGVSGLMVALQLPRLGFGVGLFNTSSVAFVDQVLAAGVTTEGSLGLLPCKEYTLNLDYGWGVATQILGITVPGLSARHSIKHYSKTEDDPPIKGCQTHKGTE